MKIGDRVRDKFKEPKPGDECVTGTIISIDLEHLVCVKWDSGRSTKIRYELLERIEEVDEDGNG